MKYCPYVWTVGLVALVVVQRVSSELLKHEPLSVETLNRWAVMSPAPMFLINSVKNVAGEQFVCITAVTCNLHSPFK